MCTHVIERNTTIPISKSQIFTTAAPFQSSVEINVLQGERPRANQNKSLGKFRLKGIQRAMAGVPQIEVTFTIDANGIVNVSAKDLKTGKAQDITIEASSNMSDAELQSAIHDAERYAAEDAQFREDREARGKLQALIARAEEMERAAVKNKDKEHFRRHREAFKGPVKDAKKALSGKESAAVHNAVAGLEALIAEIEGEG
jgi:molecular chaperone DnaK